MAKSMVLTASGVVSPTSGEVYGVIVGKAATGAGVVRIWNNATTNSGDKVFEGDGLTEGHFDLSDGNGGGRVMTAGIYCELGGTTNATVTVVYD